MGAPIEYYCDPSIAAASGSGTIGDPWGDLQHALDSITQNTTHGDRVNVKAGTDELMTASLSYASYGTPNDSAPLVIQGYSSAAGDGGIGGINMQGNNATVSNGLNKGMWVDMHLHNTGTAVVLTLGADAVACNVEIDTSTGGGITCGVQSTVTACHIHNVQGRGIDSGTGGCKFFYNYIANGTNDVADAIYINGPKSVAIGNIISIDGSSNGIHVLKESCAVTHNSVLSSSGTGIGINVVTGQALANVIIANLVEGFSGAGGIGYDFNATGEATHSILNNGAYNNTTNYVTGDVINTADSEALGASPFDKSGSDTFSNRYTYFGPVDTGNVRGGAYPTGLLWDKGAVQHVDPSSGRIKRMRII